MAGPWNPPPEPTGKQCETNAAIEWPGGRGFACWYPQMGGYVGRCVVQLGSVQFEPGGGERDPTERCFDAWIWHDGDFPFREAGDDPRSPIRLHHCMAEQFVRFGELVNSLARGERGGVH